MSLSFALAKPFLHMLPAEMAHKLTIWSLKYGFGPHQRLSAHSNMRITLWGKNFINPIGLAAGFDKNAETMAACFRMGFGFVEIGTVTPRAQKGNIKPRVFRSVKDQAVVNRMGFCNKGMVSFKKRVSHFVFRKRQHQILGINIGKNKDTQDFAQDYVTLVENLGTLADYIAINISSPNTPGLRDFQEPETLKELVNRVREIREYVIQTSQKPPILLKLAPDLDAAQLEAIAQACLEIKIDGVILTNTTIERPAQLDQKLKSEAGGLSGKPLAEKSTQMIFDFYRLTGGEIPIVGVGGITSAEEAWQKICAGASLLQVYSGLVFKGPDMLREIYDGLSEKLDHHGFYALKDAVGSAHKKTKSDRQAL